MEETITIKELAAGLGLSVGRAYQIWPDWVKFGVVPSRPTGKARGGLRWVKSDITKIRNATKVMQQ